MPKQECSIPKCRTCPATDNLHIYHRQTLKDGSVTIRYSCRDCNTARMKKYRQTPEGKVAAKRACDAANQKHPLKRKAWDTVHRALKTGRLTKLPCLTCGDVKTDAHHDDYSKPLDVKWLCRAHHADHHKVASLL